VGVNEVLFNGLRAAKKFYVSIGGNIAGVIEGVVGSAYVMGRELIDCFEVTEGLFIDILDLVFEAADDVEESFPVNDDILCRSRDE